MTQQECSLSVPIQASIIITNLIFPSLLSACAEFQVITRRWCWEADSSYSPITSSSRSCQTVLRNLQQDNVAIVNAGGQLFPLWETPAGPDWCLEEQRPRFRLSSRQPSQALLSGCNICQHGWQASWAYEKEAPTSHPAFCACLCHRHGNVKMALDT